MAPYDPWEYVESKTDHELPQPELPLTLPATHETAHCGRDASPSAGDMLDLAN